MLPWFIGLRTQGWNYLFISTFICGFLLFKRKKEVHRTYLKGQEKVLVLYFQSSGSKIPGIISLKITSAVQFLLFLVQSKVLYMFVCEP